MFARKENNKVILKMKNGLTSESFSDFVKTCDKLATAFPRVTVCVELEGDFIASAKECDDCNN